MFALSRRAIVRVSQSLAAALMFVLAAPHTAVSQTNPYTRFGGTTALPPSQIVGATAADVGVGAGGGAHYTIPITVPAGTTGVQPSLTLQFSSAGGMGKIGYGGSVGGVSYITRCPQDLYVDGVNVPVNYTASDRFCLNGQRLIATSGAYGANGTEYRTKVEEFSKIVSYGTAGIGPQYFRVWRKSGEVLEYGNTADSRAMVRGGTSVRHWALNKLSDRLGNYSSYVYQNSPSTAEQWLYRVWYTANDNVTPALAANNRVEFIYAARPVILNSYHLGQVYPDTYRITNARVYVGSTLVRDYKITYATGTSQVESVQECASAATTDCFPPTTFDWVDTEGVLPASLHTVGVLGTSGVGGSTNSTTSHVNWGVVASGDVNGDGRTDHVMMPIDSFGRKSGSGNDIVYLGQANGTLSAVATGTSVQGTQVLTSGDFNGDGRLDLLVAVEAISSSTSHQIWSGSPNAPHFSKATVTLGSWLDAPTGSAEYQANWLSGDVNGDGLTDLHAAAIRYCDHPNPSPPGGPVRVICEPRQFVAISNGNGTFVKTDLSHLFTPYEVCLQNSVFGCQNSVTDYVSWGVGAVSDYNGDGLADLYVLRSAETRPGQYAGYTLRAPGVADVRKSVASHDRILLSNGNGTFQDITIPQTAAIPLSHKIAASSDFNGDGLGDLYIHQSDTSGRYTSTPNDQLMLSKGNGTFQNVALTGTAAEPNFAAFSVGAIGDLDNNGYADIYVYKSETNGRKLAGGYSDYIYLGGPNNSFTSKAVPPASSLVAGHRIFGSGDFDGDGTTDLYAYLASATNPNVSSGDPNDILYKGVRLRPDLISRVTNGLGNVTEFQYKPMTDATVYTAATGAVYPVADVTSSNEVVSKIRTSNGLGGFNEQTYMYEGLREHTRGGGGLGFSKITITDSATGIKSESNYSQSFANYLQGYLLNSKTIAPSGVILENKTINWVSTTIGAAGANQRFFPNTTSSTTVKKDLNGADLGTTTETMTYDAYGFVTQQTMNTTQGATTFTKTTNSTYAPADTANWILGRLSQATVTHAAPGKPNQVRTSSFTYNATNGLLTSETIQPGDVLAHTKTYAHNGFGAITSVTETWGSPATDGIAATSRATSYAYDARSRFRLTETNPLGHVATTTYAEGTTGLPLTTTGPNGLTTTMTYDAFGNPLTETRADGTQTKSYRYLCGGAITCPANGKFVLVSQSTGGAISATYKDLLNRTLRESTQSLSGQYVNVDIELNTRGEVTRKSEPYFDGTSTLLWTNVVYDVLGRATQTTAPDGGVETMAYNGLITTSTNPLAQTKTLTKNIIGQLVSATDAQGGIVSYEYDALGQQTAIIEPGGLRTETAYDIRGNKIAVTDPDRGNGTFRYNALGLLVESTDAKGQRTTSTYDVLGRMLTRVDDALAANPAQRTSTWTYDTGTKGIGKLASTSGYGYGATSTFDSLGRPSSAVETIGGANYSVSTTYDTAGRVDTTTYPSGLTLKNIYTSAGILSEIRNNSTNDLYWKATSADARGNITGTLLGNGITETRTYQAATGFLQKIEAFAPVAGAPKIQDLSYSFDTLGNLKSRADARQGTSETFAYDTLNRVTTIATTAGGSTTNVTVGYDARGNITSRSDVGVYTYGTATGCGAAPHAVKAIAGTKNASYCYDLNGDMVSGDGRSITWSAFGMPIAISKGARTVELKYGPDRQRFQRIDINETGTTTTRYVAGGAFEVVTEPSGAVKRTAYIAGVATVIETTTGSTVTSETRYLLKDHLGSTDVMTSSTGAVLTRYSFDAWGKRRQANWAGYAGSASSFHAWQGERITRGFTFHEQLDSVDLVHMNGRVYDPEIGRFLSADPFIQDATNSQALNAYSYVLNNPLSFTDPSGFFFSKLFRAIGNFFKAIGRAFVSALKAIAKSTIGRAILQIIACANPAAAVTCPAAAAGLTLAAGGTLKEALLSAALSFAQVGTSFGGPIDIWGAVGDFRVLAGLNNPIGGALTHGVVSGALSVAQGGSFQSGFLSGAVSGLAGGLTGGLGKVGQVVAQAVIGGTASVLTGGKFVNGAITAAFAVLYNDQMHAVMGVGGAAWGAEILEGNPIAIGAAAAAGAGAVIYVAGDALSAIRGYAADLYDSVTSVYGNGSIYSGGESDAAAEGRRAHDNYGTALGDGYDTTVRLPSGRRPDAVNWERQEVRELKPDHSRGQRTGQRQVERYRQELQNEYGGNWTSAVDGYRQSGR